MQKRIFWLFLLFFCAIQTISAQHTKRPRDSKNSNPVDIMTLGEVKPGMTGYGLTVFKGTRPQRFEFKVIGISHDEGKLLPLIMVQIDGGPNNILRKTKAVQGMSGSPMFIINGKKPKLVGALGYATSWSKDNKCYITPIENMLNFHPNVLEAYKKNIIGENKSSTYTPKPGDAYEACLIWGDEGVGISGTVTYVDHKRRIAYALGHGGYTPGLTALPVFRSNVLTHEAKLDDSRRSSNYIEPIIGMVIFDNRYGQIIKIGAIPRSIPIKFSLVNALPEAITMNLFMAYNSIAITSLKGLIIETTAETIDPYLSSKTFISLEIEGWPLLQMQGKSSNVIDAFIAILSKLMLEYKGNIPTIKQIDIHTTVDDQIGETDSMTLADAKLLKIDQNNLELFLLVKRESDGSSLQRRIMIPINQFNGESIFALDDGNNLQGEILERGSIKKVWPLLRQIEDRDALYFVHIPSIKLAISPDNTSTPDTGWQLKNAAEGVVVLKKINLGTPISGKNIVTIEEKKNP